jgi:hypothetical protein
MDELRCADVQFQMRQIILTSKLTLPNPVLVAHMADCPACRGAFALLAAEAVDLPSLGAPISCRQCEVELAAFVEQEVEEGSAAAIRTYPHVWWHLWTCEDCAQIYSATRSYFMTEQFRAGASIGAVLPLTMSTLKPVLELRHDFLYRALTSIPTQLRTRGGTSQSYVLVEQDQPDLQLMVSVQRQVNGEWQIDVMHNPPPVGSLVLSLGTHHFRTRFNPQGRAVVHDVPSALLTGFEGPDLEVHIVFDTEE